MNIDFEKIRKDSLDEYISKFNDDNPTTKLIKQIATISSEISKDMLIKYHKELNKSDS